MQTNSSHMQCLCRKGYSGVDCSVPVDECSLNLCRNNGSCLNRIPPAGFQCVCMPQFSGVYCEKAYDVCQEQPCLNGGACRPTSDGGFHCDCPPDFTGSRCQDSADQCSSAENPCMGRGQCRNRNGSFVCDCAAAYAGEHCEQTLCSAQTMNPCQNGKCLLDEHNTDGFRCNCSLGFKGSLCEENIDDCIGVSCSGHGLCIDDIGKYRCLCLPGYSGFNCDIAEAARAEDEVVVLDHCMSNPCDHGACLNRADGFSCICDPAWRGRTCSETDCSTTSCLNGGTCVVMVGGQAPVCLCDENWLGSRCEVAKDPCQNSPCQNGGLCAPLASNSAMKLECLCQPDYGGYYCEYRIDDCKGPARCLNGGTCQDGIGNFTCLCPASFTGWRCDIAQFSSSTTIATTSWPSTAILPTSTSRTSPATVSPSTPMQRTVSTSSPVTSSRLPSSGGLIIVMPTKRPPYNRTVSATAVITIPQAVVNTATVMLGFGQINVTSFRNPTLRPANTQSATVPSIQSVLSALSRTTASSTVTTQTSSPTLKLASTSSSPSSLTTSQQTSTAVILAVTVNTLNRPTLGSQALPLPYDVENSDMPLEGVANAVGVPDLPLQVAVNPLVSCPPTFCRNGGLCRIDQSYRFRCDCPLRFVGDVCEDEVLITRPHFAGNGYLRYNLSSSITAGDWDVPPGYFEVALRFSVDPASSTANATLIEAGSAAFGSQSIQLVMVNRSRLNLSVSCGSQGLILLLEVTSNVASTNADAPSVLFLATQLPTSASSNCSAVLRWGSSSAQRSLIVQSLSSSSASLDYVLLGGSPFSASNFSGSLSNLQINKKDVDFDVDVHSGYNVLQGSLNTCWRVQCRNNGTCLEYVHVSFQ
ncbi:hypothetical protein RvY_13954-2 [Ramazzottius varieornatus]|uniref:EGF-like domain-containing protein n=1 Tax=Ramazzottius varieornatus TaxID=947166 RepID=A0A1D1VPP7_RAMVA|nr:hypothetical protein RvY_13954-2 [Ramazzottius varieornatus]